MFVLFIDVDVVYLISINTSEWGSRGWQFGMVCHGMMEIVVFVPKNDTMMSQNSIVLTVLSQPCLTITMNAIEFCKMTAVWTGRREYNRVLGNKSFTALFFFFLETKNIKILWDLGALLPYNILNDALYCTVQLYCLLLSYL